MHRLTSERLTMWLTICWIPSPYFTYTISSRFNLIIIY